MLRRWIDVPVFLLVNAAIDASVLGDRIFAPGDETVHQFLHMHTLLVGGCVGALFAAAIYYVPLLRRLCEKGMAWLDLPYRVSLSKMLLAGVLGAWIHVGIDSIHHADVQILWPLLGDNPVNDALNGMFNERSLILRGYVVRWCLWAWLLLFVQYALMLNAFRLKARFTAVWRFRRLLSAMRLRQPQLN
ncbi:MAG: hypothetical protein LLF76_09880 [Planctomycetaceae bacterium]|nr:hypothetical protein [Planctomycetaceae bacterium]